MPKISFSFNNDGKELLAVYFSITEEEIAKTIEASPNCHVDLDAGGKVVGVELLAAGELSIIEQVAEDYHVPSLKRLAPFAESGLSYATA